MSGAQQYYTVGVAVQGTAYSFDRIFSYQAAEPVPPGCRVIVPFGRSNVRRMGITMHCAPRTEADGILKPIRVLLDREPLLDTELLSLARWIQEHTFCTCFDALRTILPVGLQVEISEKIRLAEGEPAAELTDRQRSFLERLRSAPDSRSLCRMVEEAQGEAKRIAGELFSMGILERTEVVRERTHGQNTTKMLSLAIDESLFPGYTQVQQRVLRLLARTGPLSEKETCYLSGVSPATVRRLTERGAVTATQVQPALLDYDEAACSADPAQLVLTPQQQAAYDRVADSFGQAGCFLLYGVTGSGKTSVFIRLIDTVVRCGQQVILLVPEIALTPQLAAQFYRYFGEKVAVVHSALPLGKRSEIWRRIDRGEIQIVIGTRSAVFSPAHRLGLVIVDEEGEHTYKSESTPRYHAVEVAKERVRYHGCPLLLASATPSLGSYYRAQKGIYQLLTLTERYNQMPLPQVEVVDLRQAHTTGPEFMFSDTLAQALRENLERQEQSMILLNRRGYHTICTCTKCNEPLYCPNCSVPLTFHLVNHSLMCHFCGHTEPMTERCPRCGETKLRQVGFGTQRLEEELHEIVPEARVLRMDADTTLTRTAYEESFAAFRAGAYDIMIGTQMIGKGLDFPKVTLVGVLSVDKALYAGDYRSYEHTFSLITQVVGRSGRAERRGRAILQTFMPEHYVLRLAAAQDYPGFYAQEIALRRQLVYPPFCDICVFGFSGTDEGRTAAAAQRTHALLQEEIAAGFDKPIWLFAPVPCNYAKIGRRYRYQLLVKCKDHAAYRALFARVLHRCAADKLCAGITVYADMNGSLL